MLRPARKEIRRGQGAQMEQLAEFQATLGFLYETQSAETAGQPSAPCTAGGRGPGVRFPLGSEAAGNATLWGKGLLFSCRQHVLANLLCL